MQAATLPAAEPARACPDQGHQRLPRPPPPTRSSHGRCVVSVDDVAVEVALLRGPEVAVGALEGLLPRVRSDVAPQEGRRHEILAAVPAHVIASALALDQVVPD